MQDDKSGRESSYFWLKELGNSTEEQNISCIILADICERREHAFLWNFLISPYMITMGANYEYFPPWFLLLQFDLKHQASSQVLRHPGMLAEGVTGLEHWW